MASANTTRASAQINRRSMLAALPAAAVAGSVPAEADTETPIMRLYREWRTCFDGWTEACEGDLSDEDSNAWCDRCRDLADDVLDQPSSGPLDFVYKLMVQTFDGGHEIGDGPRGEEIWTEARALVA